MATEPPPSPTADAPSPADALPRRRFTLIDAMIIIAAMAIGMVPFRILYGYGLINWEMLGDVRSFSMMEWLEIVEAVSLFASCLTAPLSLAMIVLRSIRPSPANATGQPGVLGLKVAFAVMLIALAASVPSIVSTKIISAIGVLTAIDNLMEILFYLGPRIVLQPIAAALIAVYLTRRSSGRIARPVDWVERSARWLCWYWIVVGLTVPNLY